MAQWESTYLARSKPGVCIPIKQDGVEVAEQPRSPQEIGNSLGRWYLLRVERQLVCHVALPSYPTPSSSRTVESQSLRDIDIETGRER